MTHYTHAAFRYDEDQARSCGNPPGIEMYYHDNDCVVITTAEREAAGLEFESDDLTREQFQSLLDLLDVTA